MQADRNPKGARLVARHTNPSCCSSPRSFCRCLSGLKGGRLLEVTSRFKLFTLPVLCSNGLCTYTKNVLDANISVLIWSAAAARTAAAAVGQVFVSKHGQENLLCPFSLVSQSHHLLWIFSRLRPLIYEDFGEWWTVWFYEKWPFVSRGLSWSIQR